MRESEGKVEILGTRGPVIDENLVRAEGTRTRLGARQAPWGELQTDRGKWSPASVAWRVEESRG